MQINSKQGLLYVVATPIGNLQDISFRAIDILAEVDKIAVEDTRHSKKLLHHFNINTKCISLHEHNERQISFDLIEELKNGSSIALISDAGTPLMSDPGYFFVKTARSEGIEVRAIPGSCALIAALSVAGLATDRFCFEGFLPAKSSARKRRLQDLLTEVRTLIFYESPHRIMSMLEDFKAVFGSNRNIVLAKELTKLHETVKSGNVIALLEWLEADPGHHKGEMVVLIEGAEPKPLTGNDESERLLEILLKELPLKQSVKLAAQYLDATKNELYSIALTLKDS